MEDLRLENLTAAAQRITLAAEEKSSMRARVVSYMEMTPVRASRSAAAGVRRSPFAAFALPHFGRVASVFALVGAITLSGAGVSYAAESALPGDALYPVKVSVNEEVRAALAPTDEAKADWEAERAERRLAEAETLAESGKLDAARKADLETRYAAHAAHAKERMTKLRTMQSEDGPGRADEVEARLEGAIAAHEKIIAAIAADAQGDEAVRAEGAAAPAPVQQEPVAAAAPAVQEQEDGDAKEVRQSRPMIGAELRVPRADSVRKSNDDKNVRDTVDRRTGNGTDTAAAARRATAVRMIAETRAYLAEVAAKLGADVAAEAEQRLKEADATVAEGDAALAGGDAKGAVAKFLDAQRSAQESRLLIRARVNLRVRVKLNMAPEERTVVARQQQGVRFREARREQRTERTR